MKGSDISYLVKFLSSYQSSRRLKCDVLFEKVLKVFLFLFVNILLLKPKLPFLVCFP